MAIGSTVKQYPTAIDQFATWQDDIDTIVATIVNDVQDQIIAIETELGTDPAGSLTDVKTRLAVSINDNGTLKTSASPWSINGNDIYNSNSGNVGLGTTGGFVGIGTTNPQAELHVVGDIVGKNDDTSNLGSAARRWANVYMASTIDYSSDLNFASSGTKVTFTTGGFVGIGTTDPQAELHIAANNISSDITLERIDTSVAEGNDIGNIRFRGGENTIQSVAIIKCEPDQDWTNTASGTRLLFYTTEEDTLNTIERMRIDMNGRVGIGTTIPIYGMLQIKPATLDEDNGITLFDSATTTARLYLLSDGGSGTNLHIVRGTTETDGIVMTVGGDVGVGGVPTKLFTVIGSADNTILEAVELQNTDWASGETGQEVAINFKLKRGDAVMRDAGRITIGKDDDWDTAGASVDSFMAFHTTLNDSRSEAMRIDSAQNVGFQKTPETSLHADYVTIFVGGNNSIFANIAEGTSKGISINQNSYFHSTGFWRRITNDETGRYKIVNGLHRWYANPAGTADTDYTATTRMALTSNDLSTVCSNLLVGGHTTPYATSTSVSTIEVGNHAYGRFIAAGSTAAGLSLYDTGGTTDREIFQIRNEASNTKFRIMSSDFSTEQDDIMVFDMTNGNVGIGTSAPQDKLHILAGTDEGLTLQKGAYENHKLYSDVANSGIIDVAAAGTTQIHLHSNDDGYIVNSAWFGIGTKTPAYDLDVTANINYSGNLTNVSDKRYKLNVRNIDSALEVISQLKPVTYEWNREKFEEKRFPKGKQYGLIAQDVEEIIPELISEDRDGYKSLNYVAIIPMLITAIKEQQKEIKELKKLI